ncbi:hypothetical protein [Hymenobacter volaticus]|uniref:Uncharacterized protein n=1 Tax=Hymenobacter volaticus TaxID=2932254 RepID=A0ABY4GEK8_9BACT|nr:hypothetical protein [Hymenobacter volaticus]UOQ69278.1 hypothetical protein MUN86_27895 [Hymenobacter volaticus]
MHQELLDEYFQAALQAKSFAQQQAYFREQFQLIEFYLAKGELAKAAEAAAEALSRPQLQVVVHGKTTPALPPDSLADAPLA